MGLTNKDYTDPEDADKSLAFCGGDLFAGFSVKEGVNEATVVLPRQMAIQLRDDLTDWLGNS